MLKLNFYALEEEFHHTESTLMLSSINANHDSFFDLISANDTCGLSS